MTYNAICIDGSLQNLGLAVVTIDGRKVSGVVTLQLNKTMPTKDKKMRKSYDDLARFQSHWRFLDNIIDEYNCKLAIGEVPSGAQDARANFAFGGVTAMYACLPIPFIPVYPLEVKFAATGSKHADKEDMIEWAYNAYPNANWLVSKRANNMNIKTKAGLYLAPPNEHLADAVAVGHAGVKYLKD
jgi:Holliday junction resolvasome RuvABC endonuclease subunit